MNNIQLSITENQAIKLKRLLTVMVAEKRRKQFHDDKIINSKIVKELIIKEIEELNDLINKISQEVKETL